jgi:hypothetical protein
MLPELISGLSIRSTDPTMSPLNAADPSKGSNAFIWPRTIFLVSRLPCARRQVCPTPFFARGLPLPTLPAHDHPLMLRGLLPDVAYPLHRQRDWWRRCDSIGQDIHQQRRRHETPLCSRGGCMGVLRYLTFMSILLSMLTSPCQAS